MKSIKLAQILIIKLEWWASSKRKLLPFLPSFFWNALLNESSVNCKCAPVPHLHCFCQQQNIRRGREPPLHWKHLVAAHCQWSHVRYQFEQPQSSIPANSRITLPVGTLHSVLYSKDLLVGFVLRCKHELLWLSLLEKISHYSRNFALPNTIQLNSRSHKLLHTAQHMSIESNVFKGLKQRTKPKQQTWFYELRRCRNRSLPCLGLSLFLDLVVWQWWHQKLGMLKN